MPGSGLRLNSLLVVGLQFFSIALAQFLKQKLHSQSSKSFGKIAYMVQHNYIDHLQKVIYHPKQLPQASKPNHFLI